MAQGVFRWAEHESPPSRRGLTRSWHPGDRPSRRAGSDAPVRDCSHDHRQRRVPRRRSACRTTRRQTATRTSTSSRTPAVCARTSSGSGLLDPSDDELQSAARALRHPPPRHSRTPRRPRTAEGRRPRRHPDGRAATGALHRRHRDRGVRTDHVAGLATAHPRRASRGRGAADEPAVAHGGRSPGGWPRAPARSLHAIIDEIVEAYVPVLTGIADDIDEVEQTVFSDKRHSPTQTHLRPEARGARVRQAAVPLADVLGKLKSARPSGPQRRAAPLLRRHERRRPPRGRPDHDRPGAPVAAPSRPT